MKADTDGPRACKSVLLIGYGNPGRLDDGLGPALAEKISELALPGVTVESNYQLSVEDAHQLAAHDTVVFADASVSGEPVALEALAPADASSFTSHSVEPGAVLALAQELFGAKTHAYTLAIRGYEFNAFDERLSGQAQANLAEATEYLANVIKTGNWPAPASRAGAKEQS